MTVRLRPWWLATLVAVACVAAGTALFIYRQQRGQTTPELMRRFPAGTRFYARFDVAALRDGGMLGMLAGSKAEQEADYRTFVEQTGFDYTRDLDEVVAGFGESTSYYVLRGRFDWAQLRRWVAAQGGKCINSFCMANGSRPDRKISFFPVARHVMGMAVSNYPRAAYDLLEGLGQAIAEPLPKEPAWVLTTGQALAGANGLPAGTRVFAGALRGATRVTLALSPRGEQLDVAMEARYASSEEAERLRADLQDLTSKLLHFIEREGHKPNPDDLSGMLTAGQFNASGTTVSGRWPLPRALVGSLLAGGS